MDPQDHPLLDVRHPYWTAGEDSTLWPLNATSTVYANAQVVKSGPGKLYGLQGYNSGPAQFILVMDSAGLQADGDVPCFPIAVAATSNFSAFFGDTGRAFQQGIVVCNSATAPTKTIGASDCFFDAQYL
jgi:hypothetical protein